MSVSHRNLRETLNLVSSEFFADLRIISDMMTNQHTPEIVQLQKLLPVMASRDEKFNDSERCLKDAALIIGRSEGLVELCKCRVEPLRQVNDDIYLLFK